MTEPDHDGGGPATAVATPPGAGKMDAFQCTVCLEECMQNDEAIMP